MGRENNRYVKSWCQRATYPTCLDTPWCWMRIQVEIDTDRRNMSRQVFFFFFQKDVSFFFDLILDKFCFLRVKRESFQKWQNTCERSMATVSWNCFKKRNKRQTIFCRVFYWCNYCGHSFAQWRPRGNIVCLWLEGNTFKTSKVFF